MSRTPDRDSTVERWRRADRVLEAALDVEPGRRADLLAEACGHDAELRAEVERLLAADARNESFLERPPSGLVTLLPEAEVPPDQSGRTLGAYRLVRRIGQGGMGAVYLGERTDGQFEQRVAIKLLRHGFGQAEAVARFRHERQILAGLEHPGIARLYDGGTTDEGQPYLVMEYVDGLAIDAHCDQGRLTLESRWRLFIDVCAAVEHAHGHLLVHRDLKPANVQVTSAGEVKLLDFGIAKRLGLAAGPTETLPGLGPLTPLHASPEQLRGLTITTACDVYALGVLFHQLTIGRLPFQEGDVLAARQAGHAWPPLARFRDLLRHLPRAEREAVAARRRLVPRVLRRRLGSDLDAIAATALDERPQRRYPSVRELAADVRRLLRHEPVAARRPTLSYRAARFLRRHPSGAAATLSIGVLLAGWLATSIAQARQVAREKNTAEEALQFMTELFEAAGSGWEREPPTLRQLLDQGARRIETEMADQPQTRRRLAAALGRAYLDLELAEPAARLLQTVARETPSHDAEVSDIDVLMASALVGKGDHAAGQALARRHLDGPNVPSARMRSRLLCALGTSLLETSRFAEAERTLGESVQEARRAGPPARGELMEALEALASVLRQQNRTAEARAIRQEAVATGLAHYGARHPLTVSAVMGLAAVEAHVGDNRAAAATLEGALRALDGQDRPLFKAALHNSLAATYADLAEFETAYRHGQEGLRARRALLRPDDPDLAASLETVGVAAREMGRLSEASVCLGEALRIREGAYGPTHAQVARSQTFVADIRRRRGDLEGARRLYERSLAAYRSVFGPEHMQVSRAVAGLARVARDEGRLTVAERLFREALRLRLRALPPDHHWIAEARSELGGTLVKLGRADEARPLLRAAREVLARFAPSDPRVRETDERLAALDRLRPGGERSSSR